MKKKEYPVIFPNHKSDKTSSKPFRKTYEVRLGASFKIGEPANKSYLYLHDSLKDNTSDAELIIPSHKIINQTVVITGILKLANADQKVILERKDKNDFYRGQNRLYVTIDQAIVAKELIPL
ncbi:hypothetical protein [Flagellimonas sp. CMM7]|uniref:hypothetical protein n=1 Tax=Flagellimonas sp. CMM7 TaxID=2654676 RepID=UPI0013D118AC|nr:hypothetical protein [Flagellimonas sp. CMM7]UII78117.1 hypothetical protein LV704_10590 [Flagellimonas sp. CMM7]